MLSSRRITLACLAILSAACARSQTAIWANTGPDFSTPANWGNATLPGTGDTAVFSAASVSAQPTLSSAATVQGVQFLLGAGNFTLSGTAALTVGSSGIDNQTITGVQSITAPLTFSTAATINNQGALTINGAVTNNSGLTLSGAGMGGTISGAIAGTGSLTVTGTGSWKLSAANTYTGDTNLSTGSLTLDNSLALQNSTLNYTGGVLDFGSLTSVTLGALTGTGSVFLTNSSSQPIGLVIGNDNNVVAGSFAGTISGAGSLTKVGNVTLTLSGSNSYSGGTTINGQNLTVTGNSALPTGGDVTIAATNSSYAKLDLNPSVAATVRNLNFGAAGAQTNATNGVYLGSAATLTITGDVVYSAANNPAGATISGSTVDLGAHAANFNIDHSTNAPMGDLTVNAVVAGTAGFNKTGNGTLVIVGNATNTGAATISAGTLQLGNGSNSGILTGDIANGSAVVFNPATSTMPTYAGVISGNGTVEFDGPIVLTGANTYTGVTTINPGATLQLGLGAAGVGGTTGSIGTGGVVDSGALVAYRSDALSLANVTGNGTVQQLGSGTLTLTGTNTYTGGTNIGAGTVTGALPIGGSVFMHGGNLTIAGAQSLNTLGDWNMSGVVAGNVSIGSGASLTILSGSSFSASTFSGPIAGAGALVIGSTGNQAIAGNVTVASVSISPGGTLRIGDGTTNGSVASTINNSGTIEFNRSDAISYGGFAGTGGIRQVGTGTLTLTGTNTFSGTTELQAGTITDGGAAAFSPQSAIRLNASGTNLNVNFNETIAGLGGASGSVGSNVTLASGATLTINASGRSYAGGIGGAGALTLSGSGSQILSGDSTYTGPTQINSGRLIVDNLTGSATGNGSITIANGATLQLGNFGSGGAVAGNITNNGSIEFASTDTTAHYDGVISGSGNLKVGVGSSTGGTLTLNGVNLYTGGTYVNSGTLRIGTANALPSGTNLGLNSGSILDVSANQTLLRAGNNGGAAIQLAGGATLTLAPAANSYGGTIDATVTGGGALALNGGTGSSATLTHANSYSGGTVVTGGTLYVGNNTALGTGSLTLQSGSGLAVGKGTAGDITLGNNVSLVSGATLGSDKHDAGLVLAGTVTASGGTATLHIGEQVQFNGTLKAASGTTALTLDSAPNTFGHAVFNNASLDSSITSLTLNTAGIVFGAASAVPASSPNLIKGSNGYVGIAGISGAVPTASSVLSLIDPAHFTGVFGFDSADSHSAMTVFSSPVDVSMFGSSLTLGSASSAVLSGAITPSASGYLFGNGGGALVVSSNLTGANAVTVSSASGIPGNHLIAVLRGANSFTGVVSVANSELILDSAMALPVGRAVSLGADGYLGYTEAFTGVSSFSDFVSTRLVPGAYTSSSVLGIDSNVFISSQISSGTSAGNRLLSDVVDLRLLGPIGLGTTTRATLSGQIFAPMQSGANGALTLIARNDGQLTVNSDLVAGQVNSVSAGSPTGHTNGSVILNGRNTYAGGTTLNNGNIIVGQSSKMSAAGIGFGALGSGTLTVASSANKPILAAGSSHIFVQNPISLGTSLQLGVSSSSTGDGIPSGITNNFLGLHGVISDLVGAVGSLDTYGYVSLGTANTFSGGVNLHEGYLTLGDDSALGTGTWTLSPGTTSSVNYVEISSPTARTIANNLVYAGAPRGIVSFGGGGSFTLNGAVTLNNDVMVAPYTYPLTFNGPISGPGRLMNYGSGTIALNGSNTYSGGTESQWGAIVFSSAAAMPASPYYNSLVATGTGYVGIGFVPGNLQNDFIDRFDKGMTSGTIGLDGGNTFTGSIDLTSFYSSPRLGSASSAIFSGTITPQGYSYNFGGGGGKLEVTTTLTDGAVAAARSINVLSPGSNSAPLTLRLTGANTFSGGVTVTNSAVVFGTGALPATGTLTPGYAAYIGTEDAAFATNPTNFVNRFNVGATNAIVGFDGLTVTGNISLAQFVSTSDPAIALGTTSNAILSGGITLPTTQTAYRFAGYKGGSLTVQSLLADGSGARSVIIGDNTNAATFSSPASPGSALSSVTLAGANTYTGGTTLNAGELYVANDSALGTGTLTVAANASNDGRSAALYAAGGARSLSNAIVLGSHDLDLGGVNNLTLAGSISGSGELRKVGSGTLTLSGANSFSGDMYLQGGNVVFTTGASVGTGSLEFGLIGSSATFLDNSTVNGIYADLNIDTINLTAGKTLTVNQTFDSQFEGTFAGSTAGLILTGSGYHLHMDGASTFSGPTTIQGGLVAVAGDANAFGASTNPVTVNGGKLATAAGVVVANPITLTSGAVGGVGTLKAAAGSLGFNIGSGLTLAPGLGGPGTMRFDGSLISTSVLILSNGGTYRWQLLDAASGTGFDTIAVNGAVSVAATAAAPFNFSINSIVADGTNGLAANFDPTQSYSWTVLSATSITGFTGTNQFAIDTSGFWNPNSGAFSFSVNSSNTALMLNFTPVPEPSTYALMIAGLGTLLFVSRRRRR